MARIRMLGSELNDFGFCPQSDPDKTDIAVIEIETTLTKKLSSVLGCEWCFDDAGIAHKFGGKVGLPLNVDGGLIELGDRSWPIVRAWKWRVFHAGDGESDNTLRVACRVQIAEEIVVLFGWCTEQRKQSFGCVIAPKQMSFGEDEEVEDDSEQPASVATMKGKRD